MKRPLGRSIVAGALALLLATPTVGAAGADLATGIRQVDEGDYEGAVLTLGEVIRDLRSQPGKEKDQAQAHLYLGIARLALGETTAAGISFREALALDPTLRLSPTRYSPKVIAAFEEARREEEARRDAEASQPVPAAKKHGSGGRIALLAGIGAAAGAAAVVLTRGGSQAPGGLRLLGALFATPVLECPNGSLESPLPVTVLVEADNSGSEAVSLSSASLTLIIVTSPAVPSEVGFASSAPTTVTPSSVGARGNATLRVDSSLLCSNGSRDAARFNEWTGRVTLTTSAGVLSVETTDRLRVNIP
jgi:hypothetical protein